MIWYLEEALHASVLPSFVRLPTVWSFLLLLKGLEAHQLGSHQNNKDNVRRVSHFG